jgi:hypothetical protein
VSRAPRGVGSGRARPARGAWRRRRRGGTACAGESPSMPSACAAALGDEEEPAGAGVCCDASRQAGRFVGRRGSAGTRAVLRAAGGRRLRRARRAVLRAGRLLPGGVLAAQRRFRRLAADPLRRFVTGGVGRRRGCDALRADRPCGWRASAARASSCASRRGGRPAASRLRRCAAAGGGSPAAAGAGGCVATHASTRLAAGWGGLDRLLARRAPGCRKEAAATRASSPHAAGADEPPPVSYAVLRAGGVRHARRGVTPAGPRRAGEAPPQGATPWGA